MEENRINDVFENVVENQPESIAENETLEVETTVEPQTEDTTEAGETESSNHRPKKNKKKSKMGLLVRALIIVGFSIILSLVIMTGFMDINGLKPGASSETKDVYIEKGSNTAQIAKILHENGIIEQPLLFRIYCKLGENGNFQYGYHPLAENMSYEQITYELKKLAKKEDVVEVTVVEGWNLYQIAKELKEKKVISDINEFIKTVERMEVSYDFLKEVPDKQYRYYKYEGYFYPDKYEFYTGTDDYEGIAKKFFANFNKHIDSEIRDAIEQSEYSFDEIITIASLIQAEAGDVYEMGKVSSVFHNRLKSSMFPSLQSDVTINYVENVIKPTIAYPDQNLYDAYNTYKCKGLMPGPICTPTKEAIRAALYPNTTNYYYFVTDHTGKYYYATSYAQHQRNCATAQRVNNSLKQGK